MCQDKIINDIVDCWSDLNPTVGYTGGHLSKLTSVFIQSAANMQGMRARIEKLRQQLDKIADADLRTTAAAVLTSLRTQIDLSRPSGAGPSGTGMGGVWAAADGIFYIVLKEKDGSKAEWVLEYLDAVLEAVEFETARWAGQNFTIEVCRECLNTVSYMQGTLESLLKARDHDAAATKKATAIKEALKHYQALFDVEGLDSPDFGVYWKIFQQWNAVTGPTTAKGYPECLKNYYQLTKSAEEIDTIAQGWLEIDLPVTAHIADRINQRLFRDRHLASLGDIWQAVSKTYAVELTREYLKEIVTACNDFGQEHIIGFTAEDRVFFDPTPDYLVNLVTGGEDFAVNYLNPQQAYSQLYLTKSKNTSLLTMINILVHEASHGFNFVLSAKHAPSPLLNLNTALEVPQTEGQAYYREYQYWAAAQNLLGRTDLDPKQTAYLELYGNTPEKQADGVLCAQLETYIWRVIRYIRALCDVRVNGGKQTYTDFIAWAARFTGLSEEMLHGECFTFLAAPGYAPCYALGGAVYASAQKSALLAGVPEIDFNTQTSEMGFYAWPIDMRKMDEIATRGGGA